MHRLSVPYGPASRGRRVRITYASSQFFLTVFERVYGDKDSARFEQILGCVFGNFDVPSILEILFDSFSGKVDKKCAFFLADLNSI